MRSNEKKLELSKIFKWGPNASGDDAEHSCVLTIIEAKGCEFEDVLMYDCLTYQSNPCWQIVFKYLHDCASKRGSGSTREAQKHIEKLIEKDAEWLDEQLKRIRKECGAFTKGAVTEEDPDQLLFLQEYALHALQIHAAMEILCRIKMLYVGITRVRRNL